MKKIIYLGIAIILFSGSQECVSTFDIGIPEELRGKTFEIDGKKMFSLTLDNTPRANYYDGKVSITFEINNIKITADDTFKTSEYVSGVADNGAMKDMHVKTINSLADIQEVLKGNTPFSVRAQSFQKGTETRDTSLYNSVRNVYAISFITPDTEIYISPNDRPRGSVAIHLFFDNRDSMEPKLFIFFTTAEGVTGVAAYGGDHNIARKIENKDTDIFYIGYLEPTSP